MMNTLLYISLLLIILFDLILIAARSAFQNVSQARLLSLRDSKEFQVNQALVLTPMPVRVRAALNLALVLTRFLAAGLFFLLMRTWILFNSTILLVLLLSLAGLVLFWFEWLTERWVVRNPEIWAARLAGFTRLVTFLFALGTALPVRILGEPADGNTSLVTEDDLKSLVDVGQEEGVFEVKERHMIYSIFKLGETLAREIMVPRIDMISLDVNTSTEHAIEVMLHSGHSRIPVYEDNVDQTLGILYVKDLLQVVRNGEHSSSLKDLLRPVYFIPEAKRLDSLLAEMQSQRIHIAIVVDEYGGVAGLVTLEDIVEEIVGEIQDEYDQEEEMPYLEMPDGQIVFLGKVDLDDFNEIMDTDLSKEEADTIGGYMYSRLGRVPAVGEKVLQDNLLLTVEQVSSRRIRKVRAQKLPQISSQETIKNTINEYEQGES